jgi:hypothetical protein
LLAQGPEIAGYGLAAAVVLGDAARVRAEMERDPGAATRPDRRTGWTPLHAVCASRWHYLDPARAPGLLATARLLLDRGADIEARDTTWDSTPLAWAIVGSGERPRSNPRPDWTATVRILLDAGASTDGIELSPDDRKAPSPEVADVLREAGVPDRDTTARPVQ